MALSAEMPHIGVEGFAAGDAQHHHSQDEEPLEPVVEEKVNGMPGIDCRQDFGVFGDGPQAQNPDDDKPDNHDRAE